jgi:hypothetical protein
MTSWVSAAHVREWIRAEKAKVVDPAISAAFVAYLATLPWIGPHLDWQMLRGSRLRLVGDPDVLAWVHNRRIGRHRYALVVHASSEPGLAASLEAVVSSIDSLTWKVPGAHFLCGCDSLDPVTAVFEDFVEYDGIEYIIGI